MLVPYAYISIESIDCVLLSSFELKAILFSFSVKTLYFSLLNLCCVFSFDLLIFMNSLWLYLALSVLTSFFSSWFILFSRWVDFRQCLWDWNLRVFLWHTLLCLLLFYLHRYCLLNNCMFWLSMQEIISSFFHLIQFSLNQ